jgi:hypothetical protein
MDKLARAQQVVESLSTLTAEDQQETLTLALDLLQKSSEAGAETLTKAVDTMQQLVRAAVCGHGFSLVQDPEGKPAIQVNISRAGTEEITCLLTGGARRKHFSDLSNHGWTKLKGASLLTHDDFKNVVGLLLLEINGLKVVDGALLTEDSALKEAYRMVTEGVRSNQGFSQATFEFDEGGVVANRPVNFKKVEWFDYDPIETGAIFGRSNEESTP